MEPHKNTIHLLQMLMSNNAHLVQFGPACIQHYETVTKTHLSCIPSLATLQLLRKDLFTFYPRHRNSPLDPLSDCASLPYHFKVKSQI